MRFFDRMPSQDADGPLQERLADAARNHVMTVGLNPQLLSKEPGMQALPPPLTKLLDARCATFTFDLAKESRGPAPDMTRTEKPKPAKRL